MSVNINRKMANPQIEQIAQILIDLPPEKIVAVRDYVLFLQSRYGSSEIVDESDVWSEEDVRDISAASISYALQSGWGDAENG